MQGRKFNGNIVFHRYHKKQRKYHESLQSHISERKKNELYKTHRDDLAAVHTC